ncbi:MAG: hypothetical protein WA374_01385, partial [Acidobacteriaceae bacterium]
PGRVLAQERTPLPTARRPAPGYAGRRGACFLLTLAVDENGAPAVRVAIQPWSLNRERAESGETLQQTTLVR